MVHPGSKDSQSSFPAEGIIASQDDARVFAVECLDNQDSQALPQMIDVPSGITKEAVIVGEVPVSNRIAGHNQVGNVAMPNRKDPSGHHQPKCKDNRHRDGKEDYQNCDSEQMNF